MRRVLWFLFGVPVSWLCTLIWTISESLRIPLGRFAPLVFGGMIGSWPEKVSDGDE